MGGVTLNSINKRNTLRNKYPVIAIEGIDGAGKTTVAQKLAEQLDGVYLITPPRKYSACRKLYENNGSSKLPRFFFYLGGLWETSQKVKELSQNCPVILDRYLLSTKIYHTVLLESFKDELEVINKAWDLIAPFPADINIMLNVSENTAQKRLGLLNKNGFDEQLEKDRGFQLKVKTEFLRVADHIIEVDGKSVDKIISEIIEIISDVLENNEIYSSYKVHQ